MQCSGTNCNAEIMLTFTLMQVFGCAPKPGQYSDDIVYVVFIHMSHGFIIHLLGKKGRNLLIKIIC